MTGYKKADKLKQQKKKNLTPRWRIEVSCLSTCRRSSSLRDVSPSWLSFSSSINSSTAFEGIENSSDLRVLAFGPVPVFFAKFPHAFFPLRGLSVPVGGVPLLNVDKGSRGGEAGSVGEEG